MGTMFVAGILFLLILGGLISIASMWNSVNAMFGVIGWVIVVVYTANVLTRWVLSIIPKLKVCPAEKAVLITGCDTGFGLDLAKRLHAAGFTVYACCLSLDSDGAKELEQMSVKVLPLDVTQYDQVHSLVRKVEEELGDKDLWCVVNNAGVAIFSELEWCSMSVIEHMFDVNVLGAVRVTKAFLPLLRRSKGRVVIVASVAGHLTYPGFLSYSMTKHALVSFADGLRREMLKWGVSVVSIEPSMYKTKISQSDVLTGALDNSWEKTPEAIKEAYGFPYYQDFKVRMQKMALHARPYLDEVVDCMEVAVVSVWPKISYRCSGPADKIRLWFMSLLPTQLLDILICQIIQPNHRQLSGGQKNGKSS
ncbi:17-beta-hydroxysteroid dehydrogenase type 6-like [Stegodyphus dumicola]|uniref:17-beta-hydroxysteroid dehydrogenase type 6-like n=1 Tax=Stegodyphus dumicola TaxID=202533 RepID=UPI0015A7D5B5|nr:17-beta-hydroxysteroid dehydrogenase type 6-like [Stegodyphus dumicola]